MKALTREDSDARQYVYWDIEATEWKNVVCVCAIHENGDRLVSRSIRELFDRAMAAGWVNANTVWLAHYGGIYDHLLLLEQSLPDWTLINGIHTAGAGTWKLHLRYGKANLHCRDSARMVPGGLRRWGELLGIQKLDVDRSNIKKLSWEALKKYCFRDVEVLKGLWERVCAFWQNLFPGTIPSATLSSTMARIVRRECIPEDAWGWSPAVDEIVAAAYYGGRTERFRKRLAKGREWDINSSYPFAMTGALPTRLISRNRSIDSECAIVRARVTVDSSEKYPVLPYRTEQGALANKLLFPVGTFEGCWTAEELLYALEGSKTRLDKVFSVYNYESTPWLAPIMTQIYAYRQTANELDKGFCKLAMNGISGKLIERGEYGSLTQDERRIARALEDGDERLPRLYTVETSQGLVDIVEVFEDRLPGLRHSAAAAHVTARGRISLHKGIRKCRELAYVDTDSLHARSFSGETGRDLGQFKDAGPIRSGEYVAPKLYAYWRETDGKDRFHAHAKGVRFTRRDKERDGPYEKRLLLTWRRLVDCEPVSYETTRLFKRSLKEGSISFKRMTVVWQRKGAIDKRRFVGSESFPWHVKQLPTLKKPSKPRPTKRTVPSNRPKSRPNPR